MKTIEVQHNQTLQDIAIQHCGAIEAVWDIAMANGLNVTDRLPAGLALAIPEGAAQDTDLVNYYSDQRILPATEQ